MFDWLNSLLPWTRRRTGPPTGNPTAAGGKLDPPAAGPPAPLKPRPRVRHLLADGPCRLIVFHVARNGLCNRLRGLAAARAIAESFGCEFRMLWEPTSACPASFEDLFEPVCPSISIGEIDALRDQRDVRIIDGKLATRSQEKLCPSAALMKIWTKCARAILPLPHILQQIDRFQAEAWTSAMTGVHVRRTDKSNQVGRQAASGRKAGKLPLSDRAVIDVMRDEISTQPDTRFLLATDNAESQRDFIREFGDRIVFFPKAFHGSNPPGSPGPAPSPRRHTTIEAAVIDLWLLSRTRHILGTRQSSFSLYASVLGNVPLVRL